VLALHGREGAARPFLGSGPAGGCGGGSPAAGWSYIASIGLTSEALRAYRNDDDPTQHGTCATETRSIFATCPAPQKVAPGAYTAISVSLFALLVAIHRRTADISAVMAPLEFRSRRRVKCMAACKPGAEFTAEHYVRDRDARARQRRHAMPE
jgi:hypothetical protein